MCTFACSVPSEDRRGCPDNPGDGILGCLIWVLGTKLGSFARAAIVLYCGSISAAPGVCILACENLVILKNESFNRQMTAWGLSTVSITSPHSLVMVMILTSVGGFPDTSGSY